MIKILFYANLISLYILLFFILWSIIFPKRRVWPPASEKSWQYQIYWGLFYFGVALDVTLTISEWNSWVIPASLRYFIGIPLILIGASITGFAIYILGIKNTYGLNDGFKDEPPYKFTRNPQYLGDIILLTGAIFLVNSSNLTVIFSLTIIVFTLMPFAEETWLEEKYGDVYLQYKKKTPRFL